MSDTVRFLDAVIMLVALVYAIAHYRRGAVDRATFWLLLAILAVIPPK